MEPGPNNAITDVPGVLVGQVERTDPPYLTGTTVVYLPTPALAGVDARGGAPGTRETDLLDPVNANAGVNAIVLTGGSAYGLDTAAGVMSWLEERGEGVRVGPGERDVVPIVPAAVVFDLGRGGGFPARPTADWGRRAIEAATAGPVAQGNHGAGAGALAGGLKGGIGTASTRLPDGTTVGALAVLNAAGSVVGPDGRLLGESAALLGELPTLLTPTEPRVADPTTGFRAAASDSAPGDSLNTVIAVVATDAPLDKAAARRLALAAHDGLARSVDPTHTLRDGDTIFALTTAAPGTPRLSVHDPAHYATLTPLYAAAAHTLTRALLHATLHAESILDHRTYRDTYPSAFPG